MRLRPYFHAGFSVLAGIVVMAAPAALARPQEARVARAVNDVKIMSEHGERAAKADDTVRDREFIRTGAASAAELIFADQIIARLPANSGLSFVGGVRNLNVTDGAVLLQTPRNVHGARVVDGSIAIATTGTTVLVEHHPSVYKLLVLEGTARLYRPRHLGDSMLVQPGQMVIGNPNTGLSDAVDFDSARFVKTCRLLTDFPPLPTAAAIAREGEKQARVKGKKRLIETNLVIFGGGTAVSLVDPGKVDNGNTGTTTAGPTPAPVITPHQPDSLGAIDAAHGISR